MRTLKNEQAYSAGAHALSILAGWTAPEHTGFSADDCWQITAAALRSVGVTNPRRAPSHHSIETQAAELAGVLERDAAARNSFARRAV
jgi:hypothetical protein